MNIFSRAINISFVVVFLVGCSSVTATDNPTSTPSPFSQPVVVTANYLTQSTATTLPISTSIPSTTPDITQTAFFQDRISTRVAESTLIAQYPHSCELNYSVNEFSPSGLWLVELCYTDDNQDFLFTFSNKETQNLWKLYYKDYMPQVNNFPDGGMSVIHWSNDERFAYFYSFLGGDGGECYIGTTNSGKGLFRIDLQTGDVSSILPKNENNIWYTFSFSPTGRRLLYGVNSRDLIVLDIPTGNITSVANDFDFSQSGGYLWSPDGLQFVYSTVTTLDNWETRSYSLRLVDVLTGNEQIILESPDKCLVAKLWSESNILTVESVHENYAQAINDRTLIDINLNSNEIIGEATVTPFP